MKRQTTEKSRIHPTNDVTLVVRVLMVSIVCLVFGPFIWLCDVDPEHEETEVSQKLVSFFKVGRFHLDVLS